MSIADAYARLIDAGHEAHVAALAEDLNEANFRAWQFDAALIHWLHELADSEPAMQAASQESGLATASDFSRFMHAVADALETSYGGL